MDRKLTTVAMVDVAADSRLVEHDEPGTLARLRLVRSEVVNPSIRRHCGRAVKLTGDRTLLEFPGVVAALRCAVEIQQALAVRNGGIGERQHVQLRIGIHLGEVAIDGGDDDIHGDGVDVAAHLGSTAPPGGIVLSQPVCDHLGADVPVELVSLGEQTVENISRPIQAYRVECSSPAPGPHVLRFGPFELDTALFELRKSGEPVPTEPQVFDLLVFLASNQGRTVTKDEIFAAIWGDRIVSDAALSSQIKAARRALGDDGASQRLIATVHGRGFRFVAPVERMSAPAPAAAAEDHRQATTSRRRPSVAVLPFENLNQDRSEDYFADGITEDITTALSKNRWLTVIARNPAFAFRDSTDSIRTIGAKLEADYIVTGSVRKAESRFRITVQVVDADTGHSVWSERFDRDKVDIFELQDEISALVAAQIEAELGLTEQRKAGNRPRKNLGAWDLYQLATAEFYRFTSDGNRRSQELLRESIRLDPEFAGAHARLAYAMILGMVYFDHPADSGAMDEALAAARAAIALDDQDANSFFTVGRVHLARREYDLAIVALEQALALNPCLAVGYCGLGDSLAYEGRLDEAIEKFDIAIKLSPHDPFRWAFYSYRSLAHIFRGEFEAAAGWARRSIQVPNAQYWAWAHLVSALGHAGDTVQAERALDDLLQLRPEFSTAFAREHLFYIKRADQLELYLDGLRRAGVQ